MISNLIIKESSANTVNLKLVPRVFIANFAKNAFLSAHFTVFCLMVVSDIAIKGKL